MYVNMPGCAGAIPAKAFIFPRTLSEPRDVSHPAAQLI